MYYPDTKKCRSKLIKSVASVYPNIAKLWDYSKNAYGPEYYAPAEHVTVHLICENGHPYSTRLDYATSAHRGCPFCAAARQTSYPEQYLYEFLKEIYGVDRVFSRSKVNGVEYDIAIPHLSLLIEYDGWAWHQNKLDAHVAKAVNALNSHWSLISIAEYKIGGTAPTYNYNKQPNQEIIYYGLKGEYENIDDLGKTLLKYLALLDKSLLAILSKSKPNTEAIKSKARQTVLNGVSKEHSFGYNDPELLRFWDKDKNKQLGIDPFRTSEKSGTKVYWKCPVCGAERFETIHYMKLRMHQCSNCKEWVYACKPGYIEDIKHPRGVIKLCKINNSIYSNIKSTSSLLKLFLEYLVANNISLFNQIVNDSMVRRPKGKTMLSTNASLLRQPLKLDNIDYYIDTFSNSYIALGILQKIVSKYNLKHTIYIEYE